MNAKKTGANLGPKLQFRPNMGALDTGTDWGLPPDVYCQYPESPSGGHGPSSDWSTRRVAPNVTKRTSVYDNRVAWVSFLLIILTLVGLYFTT